MARNDDAWLPASEDDRLLPVATPTSVPPRGCASATMAAAPPCRTHLICIAPADLDRRWLPVRLVGDGLPLLFSEWQLLVSSIITSLPLATSALSCSNFSYSILRRILFIAYTSRRRRSSSSVVTGGAAAAARVTPALLLLLLLVATVVVVPNAEFSATFGRGWRGTWRAWCMLFDVFFCFSVTL